jgi:hypothetical protein
MAKFNTDSELEAELLRQEEKEPLSDNNSGDDEGYVEESNPIDTDSNLGTSNSDYDEVNDVDNRIVFILVLIKIPNGIRHQ